MVTPAHTPYGRGYDTSLNYFSHKNDFWSQANMQTCCEPDQTIIDFWHTDRGASDVNSTGYSEFLYRDELVGVIEKHPPATPLLVFYAPHVAHCPLQVPKEYLDKFDYMTDDEGKCSAQVILNRLFFAKNKKNIELTVGFLDRRSRAYTRSTRGTRTFPTAAGSSTTPW